MTPVELKKKIIEEITSISGEALLTEIYQILHSDKNEEYKLTDEETSAVHEGMEDVKQGRVFTSEEANSIIKEWLKK